MLTASATIYCPNPHCRAANPELNRCCQTCGTAIPKVYLWAVGGGIEAYQPGDLLAERYWVKQGQLLLDTQPGIAPNAPEEISEILDPYLRLFAYQPQVPLVYTTLIQGQRQGSREMLLLEVPLNRLEPGIQLLPRLTDAWATATSLRQLNWLWQMARLWQPLNIERVASTLLTPEILRVDGALLHLLQLQPDGKLTPDLSHLGRLWQGWIATAHPDLQDFLAALCHQLIQRQLVSSGALVTILDRALTKVGQAYQRQVVLATQSDRGPTRQQNEDACYPPAGTIRTVDVSREVALVVVCDGIGGHEGGDVASNLAIATIQQQLQPRLEPPAFLDTAGWVEALEKATLIANDAISQRNDMELRQERQRMGTTLVMGLAAQHELYLAHVGDSRAYRITPNACQQVTVDDDLASREVRLGYNLYRDALQHPGSGALVQALGMGDSTLVHPTVQRYILDEDCLFLLCSDGLSDFNRIEENWHAELLPVLQKKIDVKTAIARLVAIANSQNGHDNVTIGLLLCQVQPTSVSTPLSADLALCPSDSSHESQGPPPTQLLAPPQRLNWLPWLVAVLAMIGLGGMVAYVRSPALRTLLAPPPQPTSIGEPAPDPSKQESSSSTPITLPLTSALLQVIPADPSNGQPPATLNLPLAKEPQNQSVPSVRIPQGSLLKVIRHTESKAGILTTLKICWVEPEPVVRQGVAQAGDEVMAELRVLVSRLAIVEPATLSPKILQIVEQSCAPLPSSTRDLAPLPQPTSSSFP